MYDCVREKEGNLFDLQILLLLIYILLIFLVQFISYTHEITRRTTHTLIYREKERWYLARCVCVHHHERIIKKRAISETSHCCWWEWNRFEVVEMKVKIWNSFKRKASLVSLWQLIKNSLTHKFKHLNNLQYNK